MDGWIEDLLLFGALVVLAALLTRGHRPHDVPPDGTDDDEAGRPMPPLL